MSDFGLGGKPSPIDLNDFQITEHPEWLAAVGVALPPSLLVPKEPPILNQGSTPRCVAYSSASEQQSYDRVGLVAPNFDEARFFAAIGGTPNGAYLRAAFDERRKNGYPTVGHTDGLVHRIAAYYAVPVTYLGIKRALAAFGVLVACSPWFESWFTPVRSSPAFHGAAYLPSPNSGPDPMHIAGGHAWAICGYDDRMGPRGSVRIHQSWGTGWGDKGHAWVSASYLPYAWEVWKAVDAA